MSQDGHVAAGFTVPKEASQVQALRAAYAQAGVDPPDVDYVEAHGPGTRVGDPVECGAIGAVLGAVRAPGAPCLLGSVKTNVGHLEGAAGAVGMLKAVLVAREGRVPPNLHFRTPNPEIPFEQLGLRVADEIRELPGDRPRRVGVNSFGAGGTNVHVVLESFDGATERQVQGGGPRPFLVSAADPAALADQARAYEQALPEDAPLTDLSWTLARARSQHAERVVFAAADRDELRRGLSRRSSCPSATPRSSMSASRSAPPTATSRSSAARPTTRTRRGRPTRGGGCARPRPRRRQGTSPRC
jgi:acyl transferase domain-containing protein